MIRLATERPFKRHDIPIGEVFEYNGNYYKMHEDNIITSCSVCQFKKFVEGCAQIRCCATNRKDNKNTVVINSSITKIDKIK